MSAAIQFAGAPTGEPAMDDHEVAVRHDNAGLVLQGRREAPERLRSPSRPTACAALCWMSSATRTASLPVIRAG